MAPNARVLPVAGCRHRLDDELERREYRLVHTLQSRHCEIIYDRVDENEKRESSEIVDDEPVPSRKLEVRYRPSEGEHRGLPRVSASRMKRIGTHGNGCIVFNRRCYC
jgi:hypothetical protein